MVTICILFLRFVTRYNGLMWANWGDHIKNLVVVGDSFNHFAQTMSPQMNHSETNAIYPLLPYIRETPLELDKGSDGAPLPDVYEAFHDLSVHAFDEMGYESASKAGLWLHRPKEVILGEVRDTGRNEAVEAYEDELEENEDHDEELKRRHEELLREEEQGLHSEEEPESKEEESSDDDDDDDDDDDMFEHMYSGWGNQVGSLLKPDRFTPEWSVDSSTINAYTLGEKDPRQRIFAYNDEGVSPSSKQMCVHTLRSFSDPAKYIVDTIDAEEIKDKDWEDTAALLVFPGGADKFYRVGIGVESDVEETVCSGGKRIKPANSKLYRERRELHGHLCRLVLWLEAGPVRSAWAS